MHEEIAKWLYEKIMAEGDVYQHDAVNEIAQKFGMEFTYTDKDSGSSRINKKVLTEFRKLNDDGAITWDSADKFWHKVTDAEKELKSFQADLPVIDVEPLRFDEDSKIKFD